MADELHFARAAARLYVSPATLSDLIRRLETELGTALFTRTTRRVALTAAGTELVDRATIILGDVASASAAMRQIADGDAGVVRLGITPPVAPTLAPHLLTHFAAEAPNVSVDVRRMWLPNLIADLVAGDIDVAVTCGLINAPDGTGSRVICAEHLLVGLRRDHRLAHRMTVQLEDLADDVLGMTPERLFPAWHLSQQQALHAANVSPEITELTDTDLAAVRWIHQPEIDWVLLISSLASAHTDIVTRPVQPGQLVPFTLLWNRTGGHAPAADRFVAAASEMEPPPGWVRPPI